MTHARTLPDASYREIEAAARKLVKLCGGQEAAAFVTRVGHQALQKYGSTEHPDLSMPADVIADLESDIGDPVMTRKLADLAGYDIVRRKAGAPAPLTRQLTHLAKESSDVIGALAKGFDDGVIDAADRTEIEAEAHQLIGALHSLLATLKSGADR